MGERKRRHHEAQASLDGPHLSDGYVHDFDRGASLGSDLRMAREAHGYELSDVALHLRIRQAYLQALEDGRFKDLPGAAYATGFLRSYAEHVGLDPEQVVRRFKEESSGSIPRSELYMPKPVPEGRIPGGAILLLALALAGGVYGGWYYLTSTGREIADLVPPVPERLVAALNLTSEAPEVVVPVEVEAAPAAGVPAAGAQGADAPAADAPAPGVTAPAMTVVAQAESAGPSETEPSDILPSDTLPSDTLPSGPGPEAAVTTAAAEPAFPVPVAPDVTTAVAAAPSSPSVAPSPVALSSDDADGAPAPQASAPEQPAEQQTGGTQTAVLPPAVPAEPPAPPAVPAAQALPTGGKVYGIVNGSSRIQLHATQDSWVEVRNAAGDLLFARLLRPGDLYRVSDEAGLRLVTGNAGGIVVVVDGVAAAAPMGQAGQVLRDVALDPARLAGR